MKVGYSAGATKPSTTAFTQFVKVSSSSTMTILRFSNVGTAHRFLQLEIMEATVLPSDYVLDLDMQVPQAAAGGDLYPTPYQRAHLKESRIELNDIHSTMCYWYSLSAQASWRCPTASS
jgi:hypothetical protein